MLVENIFDDGAVGLQTSRNDADLMKLHLAIVDEPENLFGRRGDFIVDAESVDDPAVPVFWKIGIFSFFVVIE